MNTSIPVKITVFNSDTNYHTMELLELMNRRPSGEDVLNTSEKLKDVPYVGDCSIA